eukprot:PhF_6_TR41179/c0_g1_i1/m.62334
MECIKCGGQLRTLSPINLCDYCTMQHEHRVARMQELNKHFGVTFDARQQHQSLVKKPFGTPASNVASPSYQQIKVLCCHAEDGCPWLGSIADLAGHNSLECMFSAVTCPLRCHMVMLRKDMDLHVTSQCENRSVECRQCGRLMPLQDLERHISEGDCKGWGTGKRDPLYEQYAQRELQLLQASTDNLQTSLAAREQEKTNLDT